MSDEHLWTRPKYSGHGPAINGFGGVAAPLLAGFSLASLVTLLTTGARPSHAEWTVLAFSVSTALFLFSIQFTFLAMGFWVLPDDDLSWSPEARRSYPALEILVTRQRNEVREFTRYADIAWNLFHLGVLSVLLGLEALLVPPHDGWDFRRIIALGALLVAVLMQLSWLGNRWFGGRVGRWAMRAVPTRIQPPVGIGDDQVELIADPSHWDEMKEEAAHRRSCSWTTIDQVTIGPDGLTHFRDQEVTPTRETLRAGRYFAVAGADPACLVVLPDRVLYGCRTHVLERINRFGDPRDAEQLAMLRDAVAG